MNFFCVLDVIVEYYRGLPRITVPLPSRREKCIFTLKPITNTVADLIDMLKLEDRGIDRAAFTKMGENSFFVTLLPINLLFLVISI